MATKLQGLEPWVHISQLRRAPSDSRNYIAARDLEIKLTRKELTSKWTASTQDAGSRLHSLNMKWNSFLFSFLYSGMGLERKPSPLSLTPLLREGRGLGNLSECWIYHKKSSSPVHDTRDPLVLLPGTNFPPIPNRPPHLRSHLHNLTFTARTSSALFSPFYDHNCTRPTGHKFLSKSLYICISMFL